MPRWRCTLVLTLVVSAATLTRGQSVPIPPAAINPPPADDVTLIAQGWLLLSQGSAAQAASRAREALQRSPASPGALSLAIESEIARGGGTAGLTEYERWLVQRPLEEPLLLRRVARSMLRDGAAGQDAGVRMEVLRALADDGDPAAIETLTQEMAAGRGPATRALAEQGNPAAVRALIEAMKSGAADPVVTLASLGRSRNPLATEAAVSRLQDKRPEIRGAAAEALGRLKARNAVAPLRALLADESSFVRVRAASALLQVGDETGMPLIQELAASASAPARLMAAEALAVKQDDTWLTMVKELTAATEPEVRLGAAGLMAETDPELARSVVEGLMNGANPAIRELAADLAVKAAGKNLSRLRALLHSSDASGRIRAASAILSSTR